MTSLLRLNYSKQQTLRILNADRRTRPKQVRMYYGPGKGVRNSYNSWLLQLLRELTLYQSLHANCFYL